MTSTWNKHLESQGAVFIDNSVIHYGNAQQELAFLNLENNTIVSELSHYDGLIKISGSEAQSFLQSQFSNDVDLVTSSQAQLNSYCSPKGRILALFNLFKLDDDFYLQLPKSLLESIVKRLTMFKMRADVNIVDVSETMKCIGISGKSAETNIKASFNSIPQSNYTCLTHNALTVIRIGSPDSLITHSRFLVFGDSTTLTEFWLANKSEFIPVGYNIWSLLDIQSGIPCIADETVETFLPQMINLQLINAVSFKKGCYPGQEIVARTQYLGKLKKRMYLLQSDNTGLLEPGTDLTTKDATDDQSKGKIVNCQLSSNGGIEALAVLQISSANNGSIIVKSSPDIQFTIQELPYSFEESE